MTRGMSIASFASSCASSSAVDLLGLFLGFWRSTSELQLGFVFIFLCGRLMSLCSRTVDRLSCGMSRGNGGESFCVCGGCCFLHLSSSFFTPHAASNTVSMFVCLLWFYYQVVVGSEEGEEEMEVVEVGSEGGAEGAAALVAAVAAEGVTEEEEEAVGEEGVVEEEEEVEA